MTTVPFDELIVQSLSLFAADMLDSDWCGKEPGWVSLFTFNYLLAQCSPTGPLQEPGQLGVEIDVGQPPGYKSVSVRRNIVIWPQPRMSCWGKEWKPQHHPLAILEWKVYRTARRNNEKPREWEWLRDYSRWQSHSVAYAIEIDIYSSPATLMCCRFHAGSEQPDWLHFNGKVIKLCQRCSVTAAKRGEKYCSGCRQIVVKEMNETGYLQSIPTYGYSRSPEMRENVEETKHGTGHG